MPILYHAPASRHPTPPCTITCLFEHQVQLYPFDPAVEFENQPPISFSQLKHLSNRIAGALPVQPGSIVPICLDLSVELIASILGVLGCGAAYVILDPAGSVERNRFIVEEVHADFVMTSERYSDLFQSSVIVDDLLVNAASRGWKNGMKDMPKDLDCNYPA